MVQAVPRQRILSQKIVGEVSSWVPDRFGWIQPSKPVQHPDAQKQQGKIYLAANEVLNPDLLKKGSTVTFFVFKDASGLGAEKCQVVASGNATPRPPAQAPREELLQAQHQGGFTPPVPKRSGNVGPTSTSVPKAPTRPSPPKVAPTLAKAVPKNAPKQASQVKTVVKPAAKPEKHQPKTAGLQPRAPVASVVAGAPAPAVSPASASSATPDDRRRVHNNRLKGEVVIWCGKFGMIKPSVPIPHPTAKKHQGLVRVQSEDAFAGAVLAKGVTVEFHLYENKAGLGADMVKVIHSERPAAQQASNRQAPALVQPTPKFKNSVKGPVSASTGTLPVKKTIAKPVAGNGTKPSVISAVKPGLVRSLSGSGP
jgi:hypothetical protein